jgi:aspartate kinase
MTLLVQKYGGTSVATPERLQLIARRIRNTLAGGDSAVVVVSAMGDTTDDLIRLAHSVSADPPEREMDMLLSTGEVITAPLLAMALVRAGVPAVSLTGPQAGIRTTRAHRSARITDIVPVRVIEELEQGRVVVVAGFQGSTENMDIATLGRGGSDTSAVALAVALHAERCEILTDVAGVFTADPRVEPTARVIPEITYEEMLEMAAAGARVMHPRAVEIGEAYSMPIRVLSSFEDGPGTLICRHPRMEERQKVRGIAHETDLAKVTLLRVPDRPGVAASTFGPFGEAGINVDIIVQNVSHDGTTDLSFTIGQSDLKHAKALLEDVARTVGAEGFATDSNIAQVSVIGTGIRGTPGMFAKIFRTLAESGVNIQMISSSEIDITCIIDRASVREAVRALHHAFELEKI